MHMCSRSSQTPPVPSESTRQRSSCIQRKGSSLPSYWAKAETVLPLFCPLVFAMWNIQIIPSMNAIGLVSPPHSLCFHALSKQMCSLYSTPFLEVIWAVGAEWSTYPPPFLPSSKTWKLLYVPGTACWVHLTLVWFVAWRGGSFPCALGIQCSIIQRPFTDEGGDHRKHVEWGRLSNSMCVLEGVDLEPFIYRQEGREGLKSTESSSWRNYCIWTYIPVLENHGATGMFTHAWLEEMQNGIVILKGRLTFSAKDKDTCARTQQNSYCW